RRAPPGHAAARVHRELVPGQGEPDFDLLSGLQGLRPLDEDPAQAEVDHEELLAHAADGDGPALEEGDSDLAECGLGGKPFRRRRRRHLLHREGPRRGKLAPGAGVCQRARGGPRVVDTVARRVFESGPNYARQMSSSSSGPLLPTLIVTGGTSDGLQIPLEAPGAEKIIGSGPSSHLRLTNRNVD